MWEALVLSYEVDGVEELASTNIPAKRQVWLSRKPKFKGHVAYYKGPFIATQLNSTDLLRADWLYAATGSVALPIAGDS